MLFLTGCEEQVELPDPSGKTVKIGLIAPLSGEDKLWGVNGQRGAELAIQLQPYLLNGDKVELVIEDDKNSPELTVEAAKKLVEDENVAALLVFSNSAATLALAEIIDTLAIPVLAITSTHPQVTQNNWMSQLVFDDETQGIVSALYVVDELLIDTVTVFKELQDPHSVFLADKFAEKIQDSGGRAEIVTFTGGENDFVSILANPGVSQSPFFYLPIDADQVLQVEKATRELGIKPQILVSDGVLSLVVLKFQEDLKLLDGLLAADVYATRAGRTDFAKRVTQKFASNFDEPGTTFAGLGCEGTSLLLAAMEKCGDSNDRACINKKIRGNLNFEGFFGNIRIKPNGKIERPVFINLINNGQMKNLVKIY